MIEPVSAPLRLHGLGIGIFKYPDDGGESGTPVGDGQEGYVST